MHATDDGDQGVGEAKGKGSRPRKRPAAKPEEGKRSLNLRIPADVYERLNLHALMSRSTASDLVSDLVRTHLRSYAVHRVGARDSGSGEA